MGRKKRGWNAASGLSLGDLHRLIEAKEAQTAKLAAARDDLASQLAELDSEIAAAGGGMKRGRKPGKRGPGRPRKAGRRGPGRPAKSKAKRGRPPKKAGRPKGRRRGGARGPRGEGGLQNMIRKALGEAKEPVKLADLAQVLLDAGYKTSSKRFGIIVGQRISEMKDVKKAGRGLYTLK